MKKTILVMVMGCATLTVACDKKTDAKPEATASDKAPNKLTVDELDKLVTGEAKPVVFDANSKGTRDKFGVIPGATLLSDTSAAAVSKVLPKEKDKKLVFYCGSTKCSAAKSAAMHAVNDGHTDVNVLPEGIKGWSKAGKKTQPAG